MNTFQEISTSKRLNRKFHNGCVRQTIGFLRYHSDLAAKGSEMSNALAQSYKVTLIQKLEARSKYEYLNDELNTLKGSK